MQAALEESGGRPYALNSRIGSSHIHREGGLCNGEGYPPRHPRNASSVTARMNGRRESIAAAGSCGYVALDAVLVMNYRPLTKR